MLKPWTRRLQAGGAYMLVFTLNAFKPFYEPQKEADLPDIRIFRTKCGKPRRISFDDLENVYSLSDFCQCRQFARRFAKVRR